MKILKNRVVLGIICIIIALVICFFVAPYFNSAKEKMTNAVRLKNDIYAGYQITETDIEIVEIGSHNMSGIITEKADVMGKFALFDMVKNEVVLATKIADSPSDDNNYLYNLDGKKQAFSISINGFANGLSGKLQAGDVVGIYAPDTGSSQSEHEIRPKELQFLKVIAATNQNGFDVNKTDQSEFKADGEEKKLLPSSVTVLATEKQAEMLAQLEVDSRLHVSLVFRGQADEAQKFLDEQDKILEELGENSTENISENPLDDADLIPDIEDLSEVEN